MNIIKIGRITKFKCPQDGSVFAAKLPEPSVYLEYKFMMQCWSQGYALDCVLIMKSPTTGERYLAYQMKSSSEVEIMKNVNEWTPLYLKAIRKERSAQLKIGTVE